MKFVLLTLVAAMLGTTAVKFVESKTDEAIVLTPDNHILFTGTVNDESVAEAQMVIGQLSKKLDKNDVIYLVIDSPGGSVSAGNLFIDYANSLPQKIKPICIFCASMGYHMFQSFDERIVYSSSTLMSHRASLGGMGGQVPGELESRLSSIKDTLFEMDSKVAKRVGTSVEDYRKLIYDELWLNGAKAVRMKHADRVAKIKCSDELLTGTIESKVMTLFGPVDVTMSACPLISGILEAKFSKYFRSQAEAIREVKKVKRSVMANY